MRGRSSEGVSKSFSREEIESSSREENLCSTLRFCDEARDCGFIRGLESLLKEDGEGPLGMGEGVIDVGDAENRPGEGCGDGVGLGAVVPAFCASPSVRACVLGEGKVRLSNASPEGARRPSPMSLTFSRTRLDLE